LTHPNIEAGAALDQMAVVLVHGLFSSNATWDNMTRLIAADRDLGRVRTALCDYPSPRFQLNPLRRIPDFYDLAESLRTFLRSDLAGFDHLFLVTHSQGGLIAQRMIARASAEADLLARIRGVMMIACPNDGSELALAMRKYTFFWRHPQERGLRPFNRENKDARRIILQHIARRNDDPVGSPRIPFSAYSGLSDNVVQGVSAWAEFGEIGAFPGDHSSVVRPQHAGERVYVALRGHLLKALAEVDQRSRPPRPLAGPVSVSGSVPVQAGPDRSKSRPPADDAPAPGLRPALSIDDKAQVVDAILAVPGMLDPQFRSLVYGELPPALHQQKADFGAARPEIFGLLRLFEDQSFLDPWPRFVGALEALCPDDPAVSRVRLAVTRLRLLGPAGSEL
jgi:pimeloyl-ACP methyl ester carboxylesterase